MNDIDQTALEIARAFIPVDVVGQQRANLQVAIIEAIKKHANPKTLADVQPGGRVRLGDQAERARFEDWYVQNAFDYTANPIGSRDCALMRKAWDAALSVQPSPGGQGDEMPLIDRVEFALRDAGFSYDEAFRIAHLAARQPVRIYGCCAQPEGELHTAECPNMRHLAARQPVADQHPDDLAVDAFATAMKAKMADARAKGRGGWEDPAQCTADDLSRMLRDHVEKGDPRDVANFCMMLHQRGEAISARQPVAATQPSGNSGELAVDTQPVGEPVAWISRIRCVGPEYGKEIYGKLPVQSLNPLYYEHIPLYSAPPAQTVDLGPLERVRNTLHEMSKQVPDDWCDPVIELQREVQALIDSQAVGNG